MKQEISVEFRLIQNFNKDKNFNDDINVAKI